MTRGAPAARLPRRRLALRLGASCGVVLVVLAGLVVSWQHVSGRGELEAARAALDAVATRAELAAHFQQVEEPNAAALRIEQAVERTGLGVPLVSGRGGGSSAVSWEADGLGQWLRSETEHETCSSPPAPLEEALAARAGALAELRAALSAGADARWVDATSRGAGRLNIMNHHRVTRILLADALACAHRSDRATALDDIRAAWRMQELLGTQPAVIAQLMRISEARIVAAVMRDAEGVTPELAGELDPRPMRRAFRDALVWEAHEALAALDSPDGGFISADMKPPAAPVRWLLVPFMRRVAAARIADALEACRAFDDPSGCGLRPAKEAPHRGLLAGMVTGHVDLAPTSGGFSMRMDRLAVHFELTRRVLALKAARDAAAPPAWPDALPDASSSECPTVTWAYSRPDDRTARLQAASWTAWLSDAGDRMATSWIGTLPEAPR